MPSVDVEDFQVPQVAACSNALREALNQALVVKRTNSIEPALSPDDFEDLFSQLSIIFPTSATNSNASQKPEDAKRIRQFAVIETAARNIFSSLIANTSIESSEFVQVWNLFDILAALSDSEQCDPALLFWLVEELIDSQTTKGCRTTFDFLESRRERITAKHWKQKQLVNLRTCNELLKRLSRAEDTAFCGRVFIFMFLSCPLGDKSSVNLRGEYHTENVTAYDETPAKDEDVIDKMEVDTADEVKEEKEAKSTGAKVVSFDAKNKPASDKPLDTDALYPSFWSLQEYFSQPTKLFDIQNLAKFKSALKATMDAFQTIAQSQKSSKSSDDTKDTSKKRKRIEIDESGNSNFNPKYLTSRDLFELEISDLYFRRHILIQAAIILDFLRSLTSAAKAKHRNMKQPNKSVMYSDQILSEDDDKWAEATREQINNYITAGPDGAYVNRIIASVTSRDKGWVRWKMESCPPIERPPVSSSDFNEAKSSAKRLATSKKLRPSPMNSLNLEFLKEDEASAMDKFKDAARYKLPDLAVFKNKIAEDDFEIGFAKSEEKAQILEAKASKSWRALRVARRTRLAAFDKIDDWQDISAIYQDQADIEEVKDGGEATGRKPDDGRAIIISGPSGVGKSTLADMLLARQPGVFVKLIQHTNRKPKEGEVNGKDYHFVEKAAFNVMLDGDQFLEFTTRDGSDYGTNRKAADSIMDSGKVPLMQLDRESIQSTKDFAYAARVIFFTPPSTEELEIRLKKSGAYSEDKLSDLLNLAQDDIEQSKSGDFYDAVVVNDDLEAAYKSLEDFIYMSAPDTDGINGSEGEDIAMNDAANGDLEQISTSNGF